VDEFIYDLGNRYNWIRAMFRLIILKMGYANDLDEDWIGQGHPCPFTCDPRSKGTITSDVVI
jgi:hypothetical protein